MLPALDQWIAVRYQMNRMNSRRDRDYIRHHLQLVGRATTCSPTTPCATRLHLTEWRWRDCAAWVVNAQTSPLLHIRFHE